MTVKYACYHLGGFPDTETWINAAEPGMLGKTPPQTPSSEGHIAWSPAVMKSHHLSTGTHSDS